MKNKIAILALATCTCSFALFAALPVVDFGAILELVNEISWLTKQYNQLVDTYAMITNQYNQMVTNARWTVGKARWKAASTPWTRLSATNTYGTTGGWIAAMNT